MPKDSRGFQSIPAGGQVDTYMQGLSCREGLPPSCQGDGGLCLGLWGVGGLRLGLAGQSLDGQGVGLRLGAPQASVLFLKALVIVLPGDLGTCCALFLENPSLRSSHLPLI